MERMPQKVSLAQLAGALHVTPKYLSTLFNHDMGISISDFMQDVRIDRAKHMLLHTDLDYPEISNLLCFGSQSYFNQVFRKKTGMTPKQFRMSGM
jgi:AraC-like DNA-binding protein